MSAAEMTEEDKRFSESLAEKVQEVRLLLIQAAVDWRRIQHIDGASHSRLRDAESKLIALIDKLHDVVLETSMEMSRYVAERRGEK